MLLGAANRLTPRWNKGEKRGKSVYREMIILNYSQREMSSVNYTIISLRVSELIYTCHRLSFVGTNEKILSRPDPRIRVFRADPATDSRVNVLRAVYSRGFTWVGIHLRERVPHKVSSPRTLIGKCSFDCASIRRSDRTCEISARPERRPSYRALSVTFEP